MNSMDKIYAEHAKTVYGFLLAKTGNADLAEELTQETFYQAVKHIGSFENKSSISTWLCGIAKNLWYDTLRKQKQQENIQRTDEERAAASAEDEIFCSWESIQVLKLLHQLKDPMREVVYLRLCGSLSFRQIGEIMGQSENWARVNYYRGKEKIVREAEREWKKKEYPAK